MSETDTEPVIRRQGRGTRASSVVRSKPVARRSGRDWPALLQDALNRLWLGIASVVLACLGIMSSVPGPVSPAVTSTVLVGAALLLAANWVIASKVWRRGTRQQVVFSAALACVAALATVQARNEAHAQIAYLGTLGAIAFGLRPVGTLAARVRSVLRYVALCGLLAALLTTAIESTGVLASVRIRLDSHALGVGYLGLVAAICTLAALAIERLGSAPRSTLAWMAGQVVVALIVALSVPVAWKWLVPYATVALGAMSCLLAAHPQRVRPSGRWTLAVAVAIGALWIGVASAAMRAPPATPSSGKIVMYSRGGLDWQTPNYENTGAWDGGMFGLFPAYLAAEGYSVSFADNFEQLAASFDSADVVVLINCDEQWTGDQRARMRRFLESDGGLLVLGDHTDVFGLMQGFNPLLAEYGIEFAFDSAYYGRKSWDCCARPAAASFCGDAAFPLVHAVGASLNIKAPARPLYVGRHAFSDTGIRANVMGSFLGNYALDEGEPYGDTVLIASAKDSRLVVYGDTTAFQNGALAETWPRHVRPLFEHLVQKTALHVGAPLLVAMAVVTLLLLLWRRAVVLGFLIGASVTVLATDGVFATDTPVPVNERHAVIDVRDAGWIGHYQARVNSIGPLIQHVTRNGLLPLLLHEEQISGEANPGIWIVVAPMTAPSADRMERMRSYVRAGGRLLVVGGGESMAERFVASFGLRTGVLLGECPPKRGRDADPYLPRFRRAWSIETSGDAKSLCVIGDHHTAMSVTHGAGEVAWIADSLFFSSPNIEGMWGNHTGNMAWARKLIEHLRERPAEPVPDAWASPEMPR